MKNTNKFTQILQLEQHLKIVIKQKNILNVLNHFLKKNSFDRNIKILEIGTATGILLKNISKYYNLEKKYIWVGPQKNF